MIGKKLFKFLGFIAGLLIVYGIGYIVLENHNHREKQLNNIEITLLSDILKTNDKTNEFFTYGETKQFSVFVDNAILAKAFKIQSTNAPSSCKSKYIVSFSIFILPNKS
jgi:hypothetical protein